MQLQNCHCEHRKTAAIAAAGAVGLYFARRHFKGGQFTEKISAEGKVAVVTGVNTGIGLETVRELNKRGAKVYMLCRSEQRAAAAKEQLVQSGCDASRLIYVNLDLGSKENIRKCAERMNQLEPHIDILINNAGLLTSKYEKTKDGHEMTWGTNYLGPFLLTELLLPLVEKAPEGRIVNVSSLGHYDVPLPMDLSTIDDQEKYNDINSMSTYCKSKLANVMHARELTHRLRAKGNTTVTINSLHPGVIATEIFRDQGIGASIMLATVAFFLKSWKDGAQTSLYCALSSDLKGVSGHYYSDCARMLESRLALDDLACKQLYDYSLKAVGLA
ncbi:hypothetical protein PMAYCL1PPCAC_11083 [Pristionchus mayeri]|uniref:Dehydrogenase n=1 Tax=Pristionchus mayeri TaxID=1317129 RepID=A0AAN4ZLZ1_9BILA|nr:hypothetical protein PMAYCL1PPCAC_11083 [Pristionchus mayeri]